MNKHLQTFLFGFFTAVALSAFIYLEHYSISNKLLNTLLGLSGFALLLYIPKRAVLFAGFFIGIFWFYWIGYSFKYQGIAYIEPFITLAFGVIYLLFFAPLALNTNPLLRALFLVILSYFEPFDWNWMQLELVFVESYIGVEKYQFILMLLALSLPYFITSSKLKYLPLLLLLGVIDISTQKPPLAPLKIKLVQTQIKQEEKWTQQALRPTLDMIYKEIIVAQLKGYDMIVFPESVVPLYLNKHPRLIENFKQASKTIAIVIGSLLHENNNTYNVTYIFENGSFVIAKKVVLVPFGEYIPLPAFMKSWVNETFFNGGSDFVHADKPTDFTIKGITFRNAICYEATCNEIYQGDIKYIVASSNNAWFAPSIEPTLQNLLLRFYAKKYHVVIYHSANYKGSGVIR